MKKRMRELERMCELGLPGHELVTLAVDLMESIMPGTQFCFTRANHQMEVVDCYMKQPYPDHLAQLYAQEFHDRREAEVGPTFSDMLRNRIPLLNHSALGERFTQSALFQQIYLPMGLVHSARASVLGRATAYGVLSCSRTDPKKPFGPADEKKLLEMAQWLGVGLDREALTEPAGTEIVARMGEGMLLLDPAGELLHACPVGLRLFHEATRANGAGQQPLPLGQRLLCDLAERAGQEAAERAPWVAVNNHRGQFGFRSASVMAAGGGRPSQVVVRVRRQGSMASRLWLESARFGLSARERQMAVLIGLGWGYADVAEHLQMTRNTAVSYVRRTYEKVGSPGRDGMLLALLG